MLKIKFEYKTNILVGLKNDHKNHELCVKPIDVSNIILDSTPLIRAVIKLCE